MPAKGQRLTGEALAAARESMRTARDISRHGHAPRLGDPTPDDPKRRAQPVTLPRMGEMPHMPPSQVERPVTTPNPVMEAEPLSFPRPVLPKPQYGSNDVRRVVEAEVDEMLTWGLPRFQARYPRATPESIKPMLQLGCRGGQMYYIRTGDAQALWVAERTPWEPQLRVYDVFVVTRVTAPFQAVNLIVAGETWARQIGACEFQYGSDTGADYEAIARRVGHDLEGRYFVKKLA